MKTYLVSYSMENASVISKNTISFTDPLSLCRYVGNIIAASQRFTQFKLSIKVEDSQTKRDGQSGESISLGEFQRITSLGAKIRSINGER